MSKELNKKNIKKIEALITIKDSYDDIGQSVWNNIFETMDIPIDIIKTIMNKEYSNSFLLELLNKIKKSEGCNDIERTIINIIDDFIFITAGTILNGTIFIN